MLRYVIQTSDSAPVLSNAQPAEIRDRGLPSKVFRDYGYEGGFCICSCEKRTRTEIKEKGN